MWKPSAITHWWHSANSMHGEMEYSIDELGELALHTRIEDMQTIDHVVTVVDVKQIVDEAIDHANKKTLKHFFDVLFAKKI